VKLGGTVDLVSRTLGLRFDPDWCRRRIRTHLALAADAPRREEMVEPEAVAAMLRLKGLGWGSKRIARELGVSRGTVKRRGCWRRSKGAICSFASSLAHSQHQ
jgi:hypothetical protein